MSDDLIRWEARVKRALEQEHTAKQKDFRRQVFLAVLPEVMRTAPSHQWAVRNDWAIADEFIAQEEA